MQHVSLETKRYVMRNVCQICCRFTFHL